MGRTSPPTSRNVIVRRPRNVIVQPAPPQGGGPLSILAAQQILQHLGPRASGVPDHGRRAIHVTCRPARPTDRRASRPWRWRSMPPPAPCRCCSPRSRSARTCRATTLAAGLGIRSPEHALNTGFTTAILPLAHDDSAEQQAASISDTYKPAMVISIEKIGPNPHGIAHTSTGTPTAADRARAECLFDEAARRRIPARHRRQRQRAGLRPDRRRGGANTKPNGERLCTRVH